MCACSYTSAGKKAKFPRKDRRVRKILNRDAGCWFMLGESQRGRRAAEMHYQDGFCDISVGVY